LKYTKHGKVLLGCRWRAETLSIEIWDTGVGIPEEEHQAIFEEYHQLGNAARERSRGLGLGLSIVRRLGDLLGHQVTVRSTPGKGSVFSIEVALPPSRTALQFEQCGHGKDAAIAEGVRGSGAILIVEDDPEVRGLLELLLKDEGHRTATAADGAAALQLVERGTLQPDLILADYNLPNAMNGIQVGAKLREKLHCRIPVIILTGDISTGTLRDISRQDCVQLNKPVRLKELTQAIRRLLTTSQPAAQSRAPRPAEAANAPTSPVIFVVDDDSHIREGIRGMFEEEGLAVEDYADCEAFLEAYRPGREACLLIDAYLPGMNGLELLQRLRSTGDRLPAIMITGNSDVTMAVQAVRLAGDRGKSRREAHAARAPDHGAGPRRRPQQEYRRGPRHQPAHRREPSRRNHGKDRVEVSSGIGTIGACRRPERRRRAARSTGTSGYGRAANGR
jgi:two-component system CheB/CheR fusion protein